MKKFLYDNNKILKKVISSEPINKTARLVVKDGEGYYRRYNKHNKYFSTLEDTQLATIPKRISNNLLNLKFGKMKVVGLLGKHKKRTGVKTTGKERYWVVQCQCGIYEVRKARNIRMSINKKKNSCCVFCNIIR